MSGINATGTQDYSWLLDSVQTKKQDSTAHVNYQSNEQDSLAGFIEINANLKSVLTSYNEAKNAFNSEFKENMSALSESAKEIEKYSFSVAKEGAITNTETTDENGIITTKTTYSKDLQSALDVVNEFVSNYNTSLKFLNDNASVSKRVENLASVFGDAGYRAANYESIGLFVTSGGMLEINEEMLANAIVNNPDKVSSILGKDGLAGKAEEHVSFANSQAENLFPSAQKMLGEQLDAASLYTGKAYRNMSAYANIGNLLNMMF
ncbi:MAG: hypothetical protein IKZ53_11145 [Selenomonadaceae bacterium]|nr:hypothetical protein [Selenomonadaceae bacterium]